MEIIVNGEAQHCADAASIADLLQEWQHDATKVVVEHNGAIVATGNFALTRLQAGDTLEIVQFVGGG